MSREQRTKETECIKRAENPTSSRDAAIRERNKRERGISVEQSDEQTENATSEGDGRAGKL